MKANVKADVRTGARVGARAGRTAWLMAVCAIAVACALAACGNTVATLSLEDMTAVSGVRVEAENAGADQEAVSQGAITVAEGDVIVISPSLDKGGFNLTITSAEDGTVVYDDEASGRVMYQIGALPGTYDVSVSGNNGATGWMTVFAASESQLAATSDALGEELESLGVDPSVVTDAE